MIKVTPSRPIGFPQFAITRDGCAELYGDEQELMAAVGKRGSEGQPLPGYIGMDIIDQDGRLFRVLTATEGRDIGPLYPGLSIGRFLFRTRRVEANLGISFVRKLSVNE